MSAAGGDQPKLSDYQKMDKIGEGTYGVVYKGRNLQTGQLVAMKKIRLESDEEGIPSTSVREISMLRELKHPNIVDLQCVIMEEHRLYLIFEFLSMDLKRYMDKHCGGKPMPAATVQFFLYQILQGMHFCHQRRVIHRDLKPQNLLVDIETLTIKLADFGLARAIGIPIRAYTHEVITLWYRAPEILLGSARYSLGVDIWSIGCIFAEMARGKPLFQGDSEIDQLFKIFKVLSTPNDVEWPGVSKLPDFKNNFPQWPENKLNDSLKNYMNRDGLDLIKSMLKYDPGSRITARSCLKHPFFANFDASKTPAANFPLEIIDMPIQPEYK
uniref:Protein kinase domain-containing protein n=1 Tax=Panagrolaimus sp. JU765 TaxID=591449 RepID=A0AC34QLD0_9BILA